MDSSIYEKIKELIPMLAVLEHYGFKPDRKGFICCPFHDEKTASVKIYDRSFYCFGCGAGGDVIKFTALLFGITNLQAAVRLNEDFGLCLTDQKPKRQSLINDQKRRDQKRRELEAFRKDYSDKCDEYKQLRKDYETAEGFQKSKIISRLEYLDYYFETTRWR